MFKRPLLWLGLLLGSLAVFGSFRRRTVTSQVASLEWISELTGDAVIVCDAAGKIVRVNAAAQALFGPAGAGMSRLCYSTGQPVPSGQLPLSRALRTGKTASGAGYRCTAADGSSPVLDVSARPLPGGGAAAVFRLVTALHESGARARGAEARHEAVQNLSRRLSKIETKEEIGRVIVESARALLGALPGVQVRLYSYDLAAQMLTRLASDPEDQPKRPKTSVQALPPAFRFDAQVPALWQLYIARQPCEDGLTTLDEEISASAYALPLLTQGVAIGHLSLASSSIGVFDDPALRATLDIIAALAALALAVPQSADLAAALQTQGEAVREIVQAIAGGVDQSRSADLITGHVRRIAGVEVCTLSVLTDGKLSAAGKAFQDDLLFPERIGPNDPALHGKTVQKAWRTQKAVLRLGIVNPSYETGLWRAFAGKSGQHSVTAVPLASRQGVLTVYTSGAAPMTDAQTKFLETVAALISMGLTQASVPEASSNSQ